MRSLEECKAEIFRRSENIIKKRKQRRNRILAVCIPLCLCVGALALWGVGQDDSAVNKSDAPPKNGFGFLEAPKAEAAPESVLPNENFIMADSSAAISQYDYVQLLFEDAADMEHPDSQLKDAPTAAPFHFTLCAPDGTVVSYTLTGNVLCEEGRSVTLTDTQLQELKQILGIQEVAE